MNAVAGTRRTVVFVTGAFVSHHCWDDFRAHFAARGFDCHVPPHPYKDAPPAVLRSQHPRSPIAENRLGTVLTMYEDFIRQLPDKPILIGHSYGGLLTQLLLQQDLGSAAVVIDSVPPQGVMSLKWSFIRSVTPALGLFSDVNQTYLMSFEHWQYTFTNGMSRTEQLESYNRLVVPESKRMSRDALTPAAKIQFSRPHAPLLFIAGSEDHIIPASLNYANFKRYERHHGSITEFKELAGRNHYVLGQPNFRETADEVIHWVEGLATRRERYVVRGSRASLPRLQRV